MSFLDQEYAVDELPQSSGYEVLPAGWYSANITGAELKTTKAGNGQYIAVRYDITGPTHQGRVVFGNLNIKNPNPKAEEIGRQQLGDIMRSIGLSKVSDTDQLIGGSLSIKLDIRKSEEYGNSNDVKGFKSLNGSAAPTVTKEPVDQTSASGKSAPPWATKK
jgi:hypothetical protein